MKKIIKVPVRGEFHFVPKRKRNPVLAAVDWSIDVEVPSFDDSDIPTVVVCKNSSLSHYSDAPETVRIRHHNGSFYAKQDGKADIQPEEQFASMLKKDYFYESDNAYRVRRDEYRTHIFDLEELRISKEYNGRYNREQLDFEVEEKSNLMQELASSYLFIGGDIYRKSGIPFIRAYVNYTSRYDSCGVEFCMTDENDPSLDFEDIYPASMYFNIHDMESANAWLDSMTRDGEEFHRSINMNLIECSSDYSDERIELNEAVRVCRKVFASTKKIEEHPDDYIHCWMASRRILEKGADCGDVDVLLDNMIEMEEIKIAKSCEVFKTEPSRSLSLMVLEAARDRWRSRAINIDLNSSTLPSP